MPRSTQKTDGLGHMQAAFHLDRPATGFLHHPRCRPERRLRALLIAAERQIDDHQGPLGSAHDGLALQDHHLQGNGDRRLEAMHDIAEGIPDEDEVDEIVDNCCRMGVIRR